MNCINLKIAAINVNSITSNHKRFELLEFNEIIKKRPELQPSASQNGNYDDSLTMTMTHPYIRYVQLAFK